MLLSELAIIYLAAAAPFGVGHFLDRRARGARHTRRVATSAAAALAWPLTALLFLLRRDGTRAAGANGPDGGLARGERKIERAKRSAVNALRAVEDLLAERGRLDEAGRHALFAARECVERYAGLALACAGAREEAAPTAREMELCRIAGRAGDDLLAAGRCVHRRNVTRLLAHRERARTELVHALADVRDLAHKLYPPPRQFHSAGRPGGAEAAEPACGGGVREVSEALTQALARAFELLSLFDDRATATSVARLLDAERARLRRLEAGGAPVPAVTREGGESCTTRADHKAFATPPLPTTTSSGG
jgi:hypothetical protein